MALYSSSLANLAVRNSPIMASQILEAFHTPENISARESSDVDMSLEEAQTKWGNRIFSVEGYLSVLISLFHCSSLPVPYPHTPHHLPDTPTHTSLEHEGDWKDNISITRFNTRAWYFPFLLLTDRSAGHGTLWCCVWIPNTEDGSCGLGLCGHQRKFQGFIC